MSTLIVGDIQGCFGPLMRGLTAAGFDPDHDTLWSVGDLVNRGPESLATLRFFHQLGEHAKVVLGNHDLHLLAVAEGIRPLKKGDTLQAILDAPDAADLLHWLRQQPLLRVEGEHEHMLVHAGIPPCWNVQQARQYASEVETALRGDDYRSYLETMYGNTPDVWDDTLQGPERLRLITNYLTRMRFCDAQGRLELQCKQGPEQAPAGFAPWYSHPNPGVDKHRLFFGHWAALAGAATKPGWRALDTGCVWGEHLSLLRLDDNHLFTAPAQAGNPNG